MTHYVLDTNIISLILRDDPRVRQRFEQILTPEHLILGCPVVWYELRRGLLAKDAKNQMQRFEALFSAFTWQDYTIADWALAADLWSQRRTQGSPIQDADLLIAVFARNRNAILATNNDKDVTGLGVLVEDWARPVPQRSESSDSDQ
jgi:tRNA(fMet)-specific endonuclease VapC